MIRRKKKKKKKWCKDFILRTLLVVFKHRYGDNRSSERVKETIYLSIYEQVLFARFYSNRAACSVTPHGLHTADRQSVGCNFFGLNW